MANIPRKRITSGRFVDRFTLSLLNISQKKVTLSKSPDSSNNVVVNIPSGTVQILNQDYIIIGNDISWDGYGLETVLESGDKIIVTYS